MNDLQFGMLLSEVQENTRLLQLIIHNQEAFMSATDDQITALTAAVNAENSAVTSATTLLTGIAEALTAAIAAAANQGATTEQLSELAALQTSISNLTPGLAQAVAAGNTALNALPSTTIPLPVTPSVAPVGVAPPGTQVPPAPAPVEVPPTEPAAPPPSETEEPAPPPPSESE